VVRRVFRRQRGIQALGDLCRVRTTLPISPNLLPNAPFHVKRALIGGGDEYGKDAGLRDEHGRHLISPRR
jgi:hypothetical protein